ncbi:MAG: hypothetical protein IKZ09_06400, partial [Clostridia bacterium]|nr:hypothetical protein [Clostridia bacterium]
TLGDYPLISKDEATQRLLDGYFITTVPSEYYDENGITEDAIISCELTYHTGNLDAYFLPYYHFYVQIEDAYNQAEGLNRYGGFWVPAVHPDYLDPETVRDSRFN